MMRLSDIAVVPAHGRQADAKHGGQDAGADRSFGDLLERDGLRGREGRMEVKVDEIALGDRSAEIADLETPKFGSEPEDGPDGDPGSGHLEVPGERQLRMPERISIDWLSMRMPASQALADEEQPAASKAETPVDLEGMKDASIVAASPTAVDDGVAADRQIAIVPTQRLERETTGANNGRTIREPFASPQSPAAEKLQVAEPKAGAIEPADDQRTIANPRIVTERSEERADPAAPRLPIAAIGSVSVQSVPTPSQNLQTPAQSVLAVLSEEAPQLARPVAATMQQPNAEPMRILRIQLHPLELGMVTARLSMQGGAMAVELQTETRDAAAKLTADSNDIVKALRGLGIEIDRVTVTQSSSSATPQADQQTSNFDRNAGEAASREGAREQGKGTARGGTEHVEEKDLQPAPDHRGVFI